jgi:hypothetical protein
VTLNILGDKKRITRVSSRANSLPRISNEAHPVSLATLATNDPHDDLNKLICTLPCKRSFKKTIILMEVFSDMIVPVEMGNSVEMEGLKRLSYSQSCLNYCKSSAHY